MAPLKTVPKLCDLCLKNVTTDFVRLLGRFREKFRDENDRTVRILRKYFAENVPQSASADVLDKIMQDGNLDTETKASIFLLNPC